MTCTAFHLRDGPRELGGTADRRDQNRRTSADDAPEPPRTREKEAALLFVVVAGISLAAVEIALIAAHRELVRWRDRVGNDDAAVVDAAVALGRDAVRSSFSSKSFGSPPRQMMNVLLSITVAGVISPTSVPVAASTRQ